MFQSTPTDDLDRTRSLVFEIYGVMYMYNEHFENGLIESGQLDRIMHLSDDWQDCAAVVLYSHVANALPCAPMALRFYRANGLYELNAQLNKG